MVGFKKRGYMLGYFGKCRLYFGGRIVVGPVKSTKGIRIFIFLISIGIVIWYNMKTVLEKAGQEDLWTINSIFALCWIYNFVMLSLRDPGIILRNQNYSRLNSYPEETMKLVSEVKQL
jgi:hypothetical protein